MSSLWTPDGERPVGRPQSGGGGSAPSGGGPPGRSTGSFPGGPDEDDEPGVDQEALAEQIEAMRAELASAPVEVVVANHCYGLFELAAVYLSQAPPLLPQARLAIDALGSMVEALGGRLGEAEPQLRDGLSQLRLAYVQIDGAQRATTGPPSDAAQDHAGADGGADGPEPHDPGQADTGAGPAT